MDISELRAKLSGGDHRSVGGVDEVIADVVRDPTLFELVVTLMIAEDSLVRMRAADAAEKISREHPEYLLPHREFILDHAAGVAQQEVRWHVAQMIPRLCLSGTDVFRAHDILVSYLDDRSRIVKTEAMTALAWLAEREPDLLVSVLDLLRYLTATGSPAMESRGRRLLARLSRCGTASSDGPSSR
jgi:hypothetical protein